MKILLWKWQLSIEITPKDRYYEIIGGYTGTVIGWTSDPEGVLEEEPKATFREISKREYEKRISE
jgi:hypothetical protein